MEPRIQYAQTKDGVSIAYYTLGEGMPIVEMVTLISIQHYSKIPELRRWIERGAEVRVAVAGACQQPITGGVSLSGWLREALRVGRNVWEAGAPA